MTADPTPSTPEQVASRTINRISDACDTTSFGNPLSIWSWFRHFAHEHITAAIAAERRAADARLAETEKLLSEKDFEYNRKTNDLIERHAKQIEELQARLAELEAKYTCLDKSHETIKNESGAQFLRILQLEAEKAAAVAAERERWMLKAADAAANHGDRTARAIAAAIRDSARPAEAPAQGAYGCGTVGGHQAKVSARPDPAGGAARFHATIDDGVRVQQDPEGFDTPPLSFTYTNWRGETRRRTVQPVSVWYGKTEWHPEKQWFLSAVDLEGMKPRDFAIVDIRFAKAERRAEIQERIDDWADRLATAIPWTRKLSEMDPEEKKQWRTIAETALLLSAADRAMQVPAVTIRDIRSIIGAE